MNKNFSGLPGPAGGAAHSAGSSLARSPKVGTLIIKMIMNLIIIMIVIFVIVMIMNMMIIMIVMIIITLNDHGSTY